MHVATHEQGQLGTEMAFGRVKPDRRWDLWTGLVVLLVVGLVLALTGKPFDGDRDEKARAAASNAAAVASKALSDGDLVALESTLAAHRGQPDFAYFFALESSPRELGDALSTVAGADTPL